MGAKLDSLVGKPPFVQQKNNRYAFHLFGFECNDGWYEIIKDLGEKLAELSPEINVDQVKEKFGGLRFYLGDCPDDLWKPAHELIDAAEAQSFKTCEDCGMPGVRRAGGWIRTLCDVCHENDS